MGLSYDLQNLFLKWISYVALIMPSIKWFLTLQGLCKIHNFKDIED